MNKTDKLTDTEYAIIKNHPEVGVRVLHGHPLTGLIHDAVLSHHERIDGRGYPNGITEGTITQVAKMVGLADADQQPPVSCRYADRDGIGANRNKFRQAV
ncbi:HD domain-containing phosphohydrolase [Methylobacter sp. Wu8]|uniref:HD-GYP domain-containing protein n=1 Tax=Methylobacter sp. Wu8 TaxID=3118457 RepID=UPI002F2BDA09